MMAEVQNYLTVLAFAFAPALLFRLYSTLNQSLGKPMLVTWLQVAALAVKIPLSIWFVAGGGGIAPMGVVGCAWATLVVNYLLLAFAVLMLRSQSMYQPLRIWIRLEPPDWTAIANFLRLGVPAGMSYLIEVTSFTLMALFIARLGTVASASHQVAASMAAVLYMMPLSMAIACSARVSFWLGAQRPDQAQCVVVLSLKLTAVISMALAAILFIAKDSIAKMYSTNPAIISMASSLLAWVAIYHLADCMQAVCAFLLRCYRITLAPMAMYGVFLWGFGLYGGYLLAYEGLPGIAVRPSPSSFWIASSFALWLVAACFLWLLWSALRKGRGLGKTKN